MEESVPLFDLDRRRWAAEHPVVLSAALGEADVCVSGLKSQSSQRRLKP